MEFIDIIILGLVQGLTEFLPVSSSGHLVIARHLFNITDSAGTTVDAFLHIGTLGAVVVYYWATWRQLLQRKHDEGNQIETNLLSKLIIATIPGAVVGYVARRWMETFSPSLREIGIELLITATLLIVADQYSKRASYKSEPTHKDALWIGLAQVAALLPGISRSGITMAAGQSRGLSRSQAVRFSFLMSAPIIAGAGLVSLVDLIQAGSIPITELAVGTLVSFIAGLIGIYSTLHIIQRSSFTPFVIYLAVVATVLIGTSII